MSKRDKRSILIIMLIYLLVKAWDAYYFRTTPETVIMEDQLITLNLRDFGAEMKKAEEKKNDGTNVMYIVQDGKVTQIIETQRPDGHIVMIYITYDDVYWKRRSYSITEPEASRITTEETGIIYGMSEETLESIEGL